MAQFLRVWARGCLNQAILNPIVMLVISATAVVIGIGVITLVWEDEAKARQLERAVQLGTATAGDLAFVQARVGEANSDRTGALVSFVRETYGTCWESSCWKETGRETPPLLLDDNEREIQIREYDFGTTARTIEESQPTLTTGTVRVRGFAAGDIVTAYGTARDTDNLDGATLYAGNRADAIAYLRGGAGTTVWFCGIAVVVGLIWGAFGVVVLMRHIREIQQEQRVEDAQRQLALRARPRKPGKRKGS